MSDLVREGDRNNIDNFDTKTLTWRGVEAEPRELLLERGLLRRWREVDWEGGGGGGGAWGGVRQVAVADSYLMAGGIVAGAGWGRPGSVGRGAAAVGSSSPGGR